MEASGESSNDLSAMMAAAQAGDREAYGRLFKVLIPVLRGFVRRRRSGAAAADREDMVQDILLALHSARASYDPKQPLLPWVMAIANNRIADHSRRHYRRSARELSVADYPETFSAGQSNLEMPSRQEDRPALGAAIGALPPRQRMAVRLLKLGEMSLKEASEASGLSIPSLKIAMHRALKALRKTMVGEI